MADKGELLEQTGSGQKPTENTHLRPVSKSEIGACVRRSVSAGRVCRDARIWALLFTDLHRAIGELYVTVERHENVSECEEVILVLDNYTRDFRALADWFKVKWEYDNTPAPQRPLSLAWEIGRADFIRRSYNQHDIDSEAYGKPARRNKQSDKKIDERRSIKDAAPAEVAKSTSDAAKNTTDVVKNSAEPVKTINEQAKDTIDLAKDAVESIKDTIEAIKDANEEVSITAEEVQVTAGTVKKTGKKNTKELKNTTDPVKKSTDVVKNTNDAGKNLTKEVKNTSKASKTATEAAEITTEAAKTTVETLNMMECEFLEKQLIANSVKNDNMVNKDKEINIQVIEIKDIDQNKPREENLKQEIVCKDEEDKISDGKEENISPVKSEDGFADISDDSSPQNDKEEVKSSIGQETQTVVSKPALKQTKPATKSTTEKNTKNKDKNQPKDIKGKVDDNEKSKVKIAAGKISELNNKTDTQKLEMDKNLNSETSLNAKKTEKDAPIDTEKKIEKDSEKKTEINCDDKKNDKEKVTVEIKKPAYSQAAAKPKAASAKTESKVVTNTPLSRSKTAVEIRSTSKVAKILPKRTPATTKCSYPFNLTTGRTTLFDTPQNKPIKKPTNKIQMISGDTKSKYDTKKPIIRRTLSKINDTKTKEKTQKLERIKDCDEYSSTETIVGIDRIESSESLKTLVPDDYNSANSIEVLNTSLDNDGWLTVKSRRLSRESKKQTRNLWANRFHRPSATTSLPTLMLTDNQPANEETTSPANRAKSEQPESFTQETIESQKPIKEQKQDTIIRQKSDVTGLRSKKKKKNKSESSDLVKNRLHSSLESVSVDGDNKFDFEQWKEQWKRELSRETETEGTEGGEEEWGADWGDPEVEDINRTIRENERRISLALDYQTEADTARLSAEEAALQRQIQHLRDSAYVDTDTTDTETEASENPENSGTEWNEGGNEISCSSVCEVEASLEDRYEEALAGMTWAERVHTLGELEALVARDPGRAQQLHAKLSQGIKRRGSLQDALRRLQAKQARAEQQRLELQSERTKRIHVLLARVEEVKMAKNQLTEEKRLRMERRLQKAAQNRDQHLKDIVKKAHDEEEKLREIAFIKQLDAENKRHEFLDQCRHHTARLRTMRRDRLRKLEVKAAREAAVVSRRAALEEARMRHVAGLVERRRAHDQRVQALRDQRDKERGDLARERAEGVRSRLEALRGEATPRNPEETGSGADTAVRGRGRRGRRLRNRILTLGEEHENNVLKEPNLPLNQMNKFTRIFQQIFTILDSHAQVETPTNNNTETHTNNHKKKKKKNKKHNDENTRIVVQENKDVVIENKINHNTEEKINNVPFKMEAKDVNLEISAKSDTKKDEDDKNNAKKDINETNNEKNNAKKDMNEINNEKNNAKKDINETNNEKNNAKKGIEEKSGAETRIKNKKKSKCDVSESRTESVSSRSSASTRAGNGNVGIKGAMGIIDWAEMDRAVNHLNRLFNSSHQGHNEWSSWLQSNISRIIQRLIPMLSQNLPPLANKAIHGLVRAAALCISCIGIKTNLLPHLIQLLLYFIEHNTTSTEGATVPQMTCDAVAIMFDMQLVQIRVRFAKNIPEEESDAECRQRAFMIVSYFCSSLCSLEAPQPGPLREAIFTILSVCAELCQYCSNDSVGLSAVSHLSTLAARGAAGAREDVVKGGVRALRLFSLLVVLDHKPIQESVSEEWWLEYLMTASRLLDELAPTDTHPTRNSKGSKTEQSVWEEILRDVLTVLGYMLIDNPTLQSLVCGVWGGASTMSSIPPSWWSTGGDVLLPALYLLTLTPARDLVLHEVLYETLEEFINCKESQKIKLVRLIKESNKKNKK